AAQETQQHTQQQPQQQDTKVEPSSIPDPYDTEAFKAFLARQAAGTTELHKAVSDVAKFLTAQQQAAAAAQVKADIEKSVKAIDEIAQIGKPKVIEAYLDGMVREDPRMKALWENRTKNPVAWQKACQFAAKQMSEEFSLKVDPELQKAQRARKEAQKQMATTADKDNTNPVEDQLAAAQGADFARQWENLVNGGH
ncbi:MAG TPA: hypothetical protein VFA81_06505, partial [Burkholderiales bacterium]|nr:hypothetical protein [Burkholderiales bacterium]